jgi:hypothetical protein
LKFGSEWCQAGELAGNVEALLMAVKATNDFEADMARRFGGEGPGGADSAADEACAHGSACFPSRQQR